MAMYSAPLDVIIFNVAVQSNGPQHHRRDWGTFKRSNERRTGHDNEPISQESAVKEAFVRTPIDVLTTSLPPSTMSTARSFLVTSSR